MSSAVDTSEQQWLEALRAGEEPALQKIFNRHYRLLLGDIYRLIPDEDTCKDLAQEVFVDLWKKRADINIHTSLRAYLRRAAVNRAINHIKANRQTVLDEPDQWIHAPDLSGQDIQQQHRQENLEQALHQAIQQLPEKCRIVFSLSRFEQLSHREISEQLGISVKTIENQITKAMKSLRETMLKYTELSPVIILALKWWWIG